jgi:hypothetical protein
MYKSAIRLTDLIVHPGGAVHNLPFKVCITACQSYIVQRLQREPRGAASLAQLPTFCMQQTTLFATIGASSCEKFVNNPRC